eukprot:1509234-Rhodomonas_salina.1
MTVATDKKIFTTFFKNYTAAQLRELLHRDGLDETGSLTAMRARIVDACKISGIDFATVALDSMEMLQIFGKCVLEAVPTTGTRMEMQERL